jgi:hypothetical protein
MLNLDAIEARLKEIMPGTWYVAGSRWEDTYEVATVGRWHVCSRQGNDRVSDAKDATFIADSPRLVADLVEEVKRLRAVLDARGATTISYTPELADVIVNGVVYAPKGRAR